MKKYFSTFLTKDRRKKVLFARRDATGGNNYIHMLFPEPAQQTPDRFLVITRMTERSRYTPGRQKGAQGISVGLADLMRQRYRSDSRQFIAGTQDHSLRLPAYLHTGYTSGCQKSCRG